MSRSRWGLSLTARHAALVRVAPMGHRGPLSPLRWSGRPAATSVSRRRLRVDAHHVVALPPGLLRPSPVGQNMTDPAALAEALRPLLSSSPHPGPHPARDLALSLPDLAATVVLLPLHDARRPGLRRREVEAFIRWQAERFLPYPPAEARLAWQVIGPPAEARLLVVAIRQTVVAQYEEVMARLGLRPVIVDLASFHLWNLYAEAIGRRLAPSRPSGEHERSGWIFLDHADTSATLMLFLGGTLEAIRVKRLAPESTGAQTTDRIYRELVATLTTSGEGRDLRPVTHLFLSGYPAGPEADILPQRARTELRLEVERLEPRRLEMIAGVDGIVAVADAEVPPLMPALAAALAM